MSTRQDISHRLYHMRLPTGALMSLPLLVVMIWYAWSATAELDRYVRASEDQVDVDLELFHIVFHDELVRDLRRMTLPAAAEINRPSYDLAMSRDELDGLYRRLYDDGDERRYVDTYLRKDGIIHEASIRFRGSKPWHWLGKQKSMKVRLAKGDLVDGTRVFNLLNEPTPFALEEQLILDLAREQGLLTPETHAARVRLNNADMGVFRYAAQPTEGLLRRGRRVPGNLYSGDSDSVLTPQNVGGLFFSREGWQQVAVRAGLRLSDGEFEPLDGLLGMVGKGSFAQFADYADQKIDLERYAIFDALDVAFGGDEHDYQSNHKLYYDPYRGLFEPVAWSFRGFQHEPWFNLVDHPLLIRLKMTPEYLVRRNRAVFQLITGAASLPQIRARTNRLFEEMEPGLSTDPYWDAYKLLPRVTRFHRFMVRPMLTEKWALAARAEMHSYNRRVRFLLDELEQPGVTASAAATDDGDIQVQVVASGHSGHRLRELDVTGACEGDVVWHADVSRNRRLDSADVLVSRSRLGAPASVDRYNDILPGSRLDCRDDPRPERGNVRVVPEDRTYLYHLSAPCSPTLIILVLDDRITGRQTQLNIPVNGHLPLAPADHLPTPAATPALEAGQRSPHIWDYPARPAAQRLVFGPGLVTFSETRVFAAHQSVRIVEGSRVELVPGTSLIFHGPVHMIGSSSEPIVITSTTSKEAFGGLALRGPATAGSRFEHVRIERGSLVSDGKKQPIDGVIYPSFLNLYDTEDITISAAHFSQISSAEDVIHATYVKNLQLHEIDIERAPTDGVDLEFTDGDVRGLRIRGAGDDCLDLMGAQIRVTDSVLLGCTNNAVSAGEESDVNAHGLLIGRSRTAILAKSASRARLSRSLVYDVETALSVRGLDQHYQGTSSIGVNDLFAVDCERTIERDAATRLEVERISRSLPAHGALEHLGRHVLGLRDWADLPKYVDHLLESGK